MSPRYIQLHPPCHFAACVVAVVGLSVGLSASPARGNDKAIVSAATANAVDSLQADVMSARIEPRLTVAEFLKKAGGKKQVQEVLQRAEEIGGPRFSSDGQACQVQMQIAGDRVARELISIAASNPKQSPVTADVLAQELLDWNDRVFEGNGSSVSGSSAKFIRPSVASTESVWAGVDDGARQLAVDAAKDNAVRKAIDNMNSIPFAGSRTIGDVMKTRSVNDAVSAWLGSRPVPQVQFTKRREVELTLWTPPNELCDQLLSAARGAKLPLPDAAGEATLRQRMALLPTETTGRASAAMPATTTGAIFAVVLPARAPAWVQNPIIGEGVADGKTGKLKTARAAEAASRDALRKTIEALPLTDKVTIGQAERHSPAIEQAVSRCVEDARPYKVDYRADGSVLVRSSVDAHELWEQIAEPDGRGQ